MLYFIAIVAPDEVNKQVLQWKQYMLEHFNCQVALKSPAHITLVPPFSMKGEEESSLMTVLSSIAFQPFSIRLKNFNAFKPRVIFVHVEPNDVLARLKKDVETALVSRHYPIKVEDRPFHPHVTIANRDLEKRDFPAAWQHFSTLQYEASFTANTISLLRHNGTRWEIVNQG